MLKSLSYLEKLAVLMGSFWCLGYLLILQQVHLQNGVILIFPVVYVLSCTLLPFLGLGILKWLSYPKTMTFQPRADWFLVSNLILIGYLSFNLPPYQGSILNQALFLFLCFQALYFIFELEKPFQRLMETPLGHKLACLLVGFVPVLAFSSTAYGLFLQNAWHLLARFYEAHQLFVLGFFGISLFFILSFCIYIFFFEKKQASPWSKYYVPLICFYPILLLDVMNNFDVEHYNAYVAPAIAVLQGKVPLVDVFCHYGLSYLFFSLILAIFPQNYSVLALSVSVLNVICYCIYLLILKRLIKNPSHFLLLALTSLLGTHYLLAHSENIVLSAIAMRYFPTYLLVYFLFRQISDTASPKQALFRYMPFILIFALNVLWSFENLIFSFIIVGAYHWLYLKETKALIYACLKTTGSILALYLLLAVIIRLYGGAWPDYYLYLKYVYYYLDPQTKIGARFLLASNGFQYKFFIWMPLAILHGLGLFFLIYHRFVRPFQHPRVLALLFLGVCGTVSIVYFVLQPSLFSYLCTGYFSFLFLLGSLFFLREQTLSPCIRFGINTGLVLLNTFFLIIMGLSIYTPPMYGDVNGKILTHLLYEGRLKSPHFVENLNQFCTQKALQDRGDVMAITENSCQRTPYYPELIEAVNRWYPNEKSILLFHRDLVEVLFHTQKTHRLLVNPLNDYLSYELRDKVLKSVLDKVKDQDIVIVEKDLNFFPLEHKVLEKIEENWHYQKVEETPNLQIFKLVKKQGLASDLPRAIVPEVATSSFNHASGMKTDEIRYGVAALFDQDKETSLFLEPKDLYVNPSFGVILDLGKPYLIDNLKIWRVIDFRVPNYASKKFNHFPDNMNIQTSLNGQEWHLSRGFSQIRLKTSPYLNIDLNAEPARYIKVTAFSEEDKTVYLSEIEVFGKIVP